jgi:hypothetical protein
MARNLIGRQDLEHLALQEIRRFPGGECVLAVEIEYRMTSEGGANWIMLIYVSKDALPKRIEEALRRVHHQLQQRYNLRLD